MRIRYRLTNIEPLRISDDSTSEEGQTSTLDYIPGSAVRGVLINKIVDNEKIDEETRLKLFSDSTSFSNAYIIANVGGKQVPLIPSPKGFYEDKTIVEGEKEIHNVVINGETNPGEKRASLGRYVRFDEDKVVYSTVKRGSDLKIKCNVKGGRESRKVFHNEYIIEGQTFEGSIDCDDETLLKKIESELKSDIFIGNDRSAGFGKCRVELIEDESVPEFSKYITDSDLSGDAYMYLLSDTVMRDNNGEYCGINFEDLGKMLKVEGVKKPDILKDLHAEYSSTSVKHVHGYNRKWGLKLPSMPMYEMGSVFHLKFNGVLKAEAMKKVMESGIGVRTNEGFGRVLFLKNYEAITKKLKEDSQAVEKKDFELENEADKQSLKVIAKQYYMHKIRNAMHPYIVGHSLDKGAIASSQLGNIETFVLQGVGDPDGAVNKLNAYFDKMIEQSTNGHSGSLKADLKPLYDEFEKLNKSDLGELLDVNTKESGFVMGIPVTELLGDAEEKRLKLELFEEEIKYDRKGE